MRRFTVSISSIAILIFFLAACATTGNKFAKIEPGMKEDEVKKIMDKPPSETKAFEEGYIGWYYGQDHCLLFREGEVVTKQQTQELSDVDVYGLAIYRERRRAQCLPPGYEDEERIEHEIETPFGTIRR